MHQATYLQFARTMDEFARWRTVPEPERAPAPAWWWGAAMAAIEVEEPMPGDWCDGLGLREGASFADGARTILTLFADQTSLPWPSDFPRKSEIDRAVRDLHPLPSDDSAFQP
jgi:hypothetical protein